MFVLENQWSYPLLFRIKIAKESFVEKIDISWKDNPVII